jgi:hypothetical protein
VHGRFPLRHSRPLWMRTIFATAALTSPGWMTLSSRLGLAGLRGAPSPHPLAFPLVGRRRARAGMQPAFAAIVPAGSPGAPYALQPCAFQQR